MEIGILQLFWVVLILVIFIASVVKRYLSNKKSRDRLSRENVRDREQDKSIKLRKQRGRPEWEDFMSDMFGIEPIQIKTRKPPKKDRAETKQVVTKENEYKEYVDKKSPELMEEGISEFHGTIEDRHIKSQIEEVLKPSAIEPHVISSSFESEQGYKPEIERKKIKSLHYNIFKKDGLKNAIIYSEIIGSPIGLRKRSIFRHIR